MKKYADGGMGGMPGIANKGGAMRGKDRAAQVQPSVRGPNPMIMKYADGGMAEYCGHRSQQDYGKKGK